MVSASQNIMVARRRSRLDITVQFAGTQQVIAPNQTIPIGSRIDVYAHLYDADTMAALNNRQVGAKVVSDTFGYGPGAMAFIGEGWYTTTNLLLEKVGTWTITCGWDGDAYYEGCEKESTAKASEAPPTPPTLGVGLLLLAGLFLFGLAVEKKR